MTTKKKTPKRYIVEFRDTRSATTKKKAEEYVNKLRNKKGIYGIRIIRSG